MGDGGEQRSQEERGGQRSKLRSSTSRQSNQSNRQNQRQEEVELSNKLQEEKNVAEHSQKLYLSSSNESANNINNSIPENFLPNAYCRDYIVRLNNENKADVIRQIRDEAKEAERHFDALAGQYAHIQSATNNTDFLPSQNLYSQLHSNLRKLAYDASTLHDFSEAVLTENFSTAPSRPAPTQTQTIASTHTSALSSQPTTAGQTNTDQPIKKHTNDPPTTHFRQFLSEFPNADPFVQTISSDSASNKEENNSYRSSTSSYLSSSAQNEVGKSKGKERFSITSEKILDLTNRNNSFDKEIISMGTEYKHCHFPSTCQLYGFTYSSSVSFTSYSLCTKVTFIKPYLPRS